jgi:hypothetical protein
MTQALSTRLKLSLDPLVYASGVIVYLFIIIDLDGVILPCLCRGLEGGRKRGKAKLLLSVRDYSCPLSARIRLTRIPLPCLSAGIKEGVIRHGSASWVSAIQAYHTESNM